MRLINALLFALALTALATPTLAQQYLHVSTIPSNVDIYANEAIVDIANEPAYQSPAFIPVTEGEITLHLFHPEFADTTIHVKLSARDTSFLIVSMRPTYDESLMEEQQNLLAKRSRRSAGKKLMLASAIPFLIGGVSAIVFEYQSSEADNAKKHIENACIRGSSFRAAQSDLRHARHMAKNARRGTYAGVGIGAALLAIGFAISF